MVWSLVDLPSRRYQLVSGNSAYTPIKTRAGRLMLAFVLLLLLLNFLLDLPANACSCSSKRGSLRGQMQILQTMLETYAVEWGSFPPSLAALKQEATQTGKEYWREVSACQLENKGIKALLPREKADLLKSRDILGFRFDQAYGKTKCKILYRLTQRSYELSAAAPDSRLLELHGQPYILSNKR